MSLGKYDSKNKPPYIALGDTYTKNLIIVMISDDNYAISQCLFFCIKLIMDYFSELLYITHAELATYSGASVINQRHIIACVWCDRGIWCIHDIVLIKKQVFSFYDYAFHVQCHVSTYGNINRSMVTLGQPYTMYTVMHVKTFTVTPIWIKHRHACWVFR